MNEWNRIREFYRTNLPAIMAEQKCEWGIAAYSWEGMLRMTPIEAALWGEIRECNVVMYPQFPIGRFFVDFANPVARVAIECDGYEYHLDKVKDRARDAWLEENGWTVYRITGADCWATDPETGSATKALEFIRNISETHRISRNHIEHDPRAPVWISIQDAFAKRMLEWEL